MISLRQTGMVALQRLLAFSVLWCLVLVAFGAFVRLSDAGLGCPDWPTCYGKLTWPKAHEIEAATASYEQTVEIHKAWPEQVHRFIAAALGVWILIAVLLARDFSSPRLVSRLRAHLPTLLGVAFVALAVFSYIVKMPGLSGLFFVLGELLLFASAYTAYRDYRAPHGHLVAMLTLTLALVCFQALLGMWTVTLMVKPAVVTSHLLGGMATLAMLFLCALLAYRRGQGISTRASTAKRSAQWLVRIGLVLLLVQITLGGWVSTNYAALACPDFPKCQGQWWPDTDFREGFVLWRGIGVNYEGGVLDAPARAAVHLAHRLGAVIVGLYLFGLALYAMRRRGGSLYPARHLHAPGVALLICLSIQIGLGISNIVFALPLWVAVAHNGMAAMLLCAMIWLAWRTHAEDFR